MAAKIPAGLDPQLAKIALEGGGHWGASDQARYDKLVRERGSSGSSSSSGGPGLYGNIMNDFFSSSPGQDDPSGRAMKQAFQGNMAQSVLDSNLAKSLGQFNAGLSQQNMTHMADLEMRNQSSLMKDEFNYGMQSMEAQFKFGEQGAQNQHKRDLGMLSATGEEQRLNISSQGQQDRLGIITSGEQDRQLAGLNNESSETIATGRYDADKAVANTQKDATLGQANIQKESAKETTQMRTSADVNIADIAAKSADYGADRSVDIANIGAQGTIDNTKETGNQTRLTMGTENQLKAKDRADMHRYARNTARAM